MWKDTSIIQSLNLLWKSMKSILLNFSFRIRIGVLFCLLLGCYTMVLRAKSAIVRSYFFCFIEHFSAFCHGSFKCSLFYSLLLNLNLMFRESYQQYVLLQKHNFSVHRNFSLNIEALFYYAFLCLAQRVQGNIMLRASAVSESSVFTT